jgi:hypothetical protein
MSRLPNKLDIANKLDRTDILVIIDTLLLSMYSM